MEVVDVHRLSRLGYINPYDFGLHSIISTQTLRMSSIESLLQMASIGLNGQTVLVVSRLRPRQRKSKEFAECLVQHTNNAGI